MELDGITRIYRARGDEGERMSWIFPSTTKGFEPEQTGREAIQRTDYTATFDPESGKYKVKTSPLGFDGPTVDVPKTADLYEIHRQLAERIEDYAGRNGLTIRIVK